MPKIATASVPVKKSKIISVLRELSPRAKADLESELRQAVNDGYSVVRFGRENGQAIMVLEKREDWTFAEVVAELEAHSRGQRC